MKKRRILIVDDSSTIRCLVQKVLEQGAFEVLHAPDGVVGAQMIDDGAFDLVLCDVNMPNMDGLTMLELVKAQPRHAELPMLMLTTELDSRLIRRARDAGAKGWMVKPFVAAQLLSTVQKLPPSAAAARSAPQKTTSSARMPVASAVCSPK